MTKARAERPAILVFSRTTDFRHDTISHGISALEMLGHARNFTVTASEHPACFRDAELSAFDAVVFLNTAGSVLDPEGRSSFERFIGGGGGWVGVHAAAATEYDFPWYGELVGARFRDHPPVQPALVTVEDRSHPATRHLPARWQRSDEWYSFHTNPRDRVRVLLSLDESSYAPGPTAMGADHPLAWCHTLGGGRAFYTALGHTEASYREPEFLEHLAGGIEWALGRD